MPADALRTVVLVCGAAGRSVRSAPRGCRVVAAFGCPDATPSTAVLTELVQVAAALHADLILVLDEHGRPHRRRTAIVPRPRPGT